MSVVVKNRNGQFLRLGSWALKAAILFFTLIGLASAQASNGTIAGVIRDPSGAAVAGAHIQAVNLATGLLRTAASFGEGDYSLPAMPAGEYEVSAAAPGFQRTVRQASVEAGATTTTDFQLRLGEVSESVTVEATSPQIRHDSHSVGGLITRSQIDSLPLNGRSFLDLARIEPGVQPSTRLTANRTLVPVLGSPGGTSGRGTRVTIDGGSVMALTTGGSFLSLSQEAVQEAQISTVNFDLSTGLTFSGAVNAVTRSGGNDLHGSAFYYFRDNNLAAYPALRRNLANPDPFFQRRQFGFTTGGPIRRDRVFFFGAWERTEQRGVADTNIAVSDFAHLSGVTPSPLFGNQLSFRLDGRLSDAHTAFLRFSHDGSRAFIPTSQQASAYPSSWTRQLAWVDQSILGLTSVFRPTLVNEIRFSYFFISTEAVPPTAQDCPGCLGIGAPTIQIPQVPLTIGQSSMAENLGRRFHFTDAVTWHKGTHRARFGIDWEHNRGGLLEWANEPVTMELWSPNQVRSYNALPGTPENLRIPLPAAFASLNDILQLPLRSFNVDIGDPRVPQENAGTTRTWNVARLFFHDTWRVHQRVTMNYGLGWSIDRNRNYDLSKPALLAPILGADGLGPTRKQWKDFSPTLGLAWSPSDDGRTVIRAGAGIFYDFLFPTSLDRERALLGPPGFGRQPIPSSSIRNPLPGIPGVPIGTPLLFTGSPTLFTGANVMTILPDTRANEARRLAYSGDASVRAIQITKNAGGGLFPVDVPTWSALHANLGVQRGITRDFVLSADFVYRHFVHGGLGPNGVDLNHFNSARGPVIPRCTTAAQQDDPQAVCSTGPINVWQGASRQTYKGLLLRADKRFSHGFQVLGSHAYSSNTGTAGTAGGPGFNLDNWLQNPGPLNTDYTHITNVAGVVQLPWRFELGLNFSYSSAPPFSAVVGAIDFNGDGTTGDLLPGTTVNQFNRGLGRADLARLVSQFNQTYAGTRDPLNRAIPPLTLPASYSFGDNFHSLDLRLSRSLALRENWRLSLIGEVFNLYNTANLAGHSRDLTNSTAFGQPTSRFTQVFGSGGPRAFQLATRVTF